MSEIGGRWEGAILSKKKNISFKKKKKGESSVNHNACPDIEMAGFPGLL
jgi:hypothetical protein